MGSFHKKHKTKDFVLKNFLHHKEKSTSLKLVLNFIKCLVYEFSRTIIPPFSICHFDHFQPADCWWRQRCEVETSNISENQMQVGVTSTCSGLWNISMNGYSFLCLVKQNPGYFGHSTWKNKHQNKRSWEKNLRMLK